MGFMEVRVRSDIDIDYRTAAALMCGGMASGSPFKDGQLANKSCPSPPWNRGREGDGCRRSPPVLPVLPGHPQGGAHLQGP